MWTRRAWGSVMMFALGVGAVSACSANDESDAKAAFKRWQARGPSSYVYVVRKSCFCGGPVEPARVVVSDNVMVSAAGLDTGLVVDVQAGVQTMTELMRDVVSSATGDNDEFSATYDDSLGYVRSLDADRSKETEDDELSIRVTCFAEGTGDELCPLPTLAAQDCPGETASSQPDLVADTRVPKCANAPPIGRIEGEDLVCCPGLAGRDCEMLHAALTAEVQVSQDCTEDADCTWDSLVAGCHLPLARTATEDALRQIVVDSEQQACPVTSSEPFCKPAVLAPTPFCNRGRCDLN